MVIGSSDPCADQEWKTCSRSSSYTRRPAGLFGTGLMPGIVPAIRFGGDQLSPVRPALGAIVVVTGRKCCTILGVREVDRRRVDTNLAEEAVSRRGRGS